MIVHHRSAQCVRQKAALIILSRILGGRSSLVLDDVN